MPNEFPRLQACVWALGVLGFLSACQLPQLAPPMIPDGPVYGGARVISINVQEETMLLELDATDRSAGGRCLAWWNEKTQWLANNQPVTSPRLAVGQVVGVYGGCYHGELYLTRLWYAEGK